MKIKLVALALVFLFPLVGVCDEPKMFITNEGVGPFQINKPIDLPSLRKSHPTLVFYEEQSTCGEGAPCTRIHVSEKGLPVLEIEKIEEFPGEIQVISPFVTTKIGIGLNSTFGEIRKKYPDLGCAGSVENSELFTCSTEEMPRVVFGSFRPKGTSAGDDFNKDKWYLIKNLKGGIEWDSWRGN